ncbi:hypothetical protein GN958_ATG08056 [Phytophthora infestans]|uniref:Uncharacterized protein n=1 Tax=Phytophthora infestans TaxID=4787 RepID=A0A8S9UUJ1_PHYIN|nr:hypothetical protein GN958_ATG08056 [Phytophthora infestans]
MFLSAIPSKKDDEQWTGMMLDCRKRSFNQTYRYAGGDRRRLERLKCVWISSNQADHHLGKLQLLISSPVSTMKTGQKYRCRPTVRASMRSLENYNFDESNSCSEKVEPYAKAARVRVWLREASKITQLERVPVKHADQSHAVVVTFVDGVRHSPACQAVPSLSTRC